MLALGACSGRPAADATRATLRAPATALVDPTVRPARLVPARRAGDETGFGAEPGGALRTLIAGVRVINLAGGGVLSAADPLPSPPSATVEVPERMGGGFLFAIGPSIYRADKWLAPLRLLYVAPMAPTHLFVGLDRAYVRLSNGAYAAFDPRAGTPMDLGPWPASPHVGRLVAADGWRAAAIADLRGLVATFDAGGRWQTIPLPIDPHELSLAGDAIVATGPDSAGETQAYAVQPNGQVAHVQQAAPSKVAAAELVPEGPAKVLGTRPLLTAVLDGWPLSDGTAVVARDGVLARVRMADGTVVDSAPDAFPMKPARCHPVSLASLRAPAAFGFVCGEPHGATEIYGYDAAAGRLSLLRHFDTPRSVASPANGTLAVEGPCDAEAPTNDGRGSEQRYCLMRPSGAFEDFVVNGDVGAERVVPLADGRTAIISPPAGDLATARLTLFDGAHAKTTSLTFQLSTPPTPSRPPRPKIAPSDDDDDSDEAPGDQDGDADDQAPAADEGAVLTAVLRSGTWLRGFEERRPGVLSGWVEHSGTYVGVEVTLDGHAKSGRFVRELGTGMVSGRYGLGWTSSRQGYETTDGGMTWKQISLPEPLESAGPAAGATTHGCGPLGCVLAGWIRVGWGGDEGKRLSDDTTAQSPRTASITLSPSVSLRCELAGKLAPQGLDTAAVRAYEGYFGYSGSYGYRYGRPYMPTTRDWTPFYTVEAPKLANDDLGYSIRTDEVFDRQAFDRTASHFTLSPLARLYAWGPRGIEWDLHGRFMVRFSTPFDGSNVVRTTQSVPIPHFISESTNFTMGVAPRYLQNVAIVPGDDDAHALLVVRRGAGTPSAYVAAELESERPPAEVHRADGTPIGDIESAVRMSGRWYVATSEAARSVVWEVENGLAREVTSVPRVAQDGTSRKPLRLVKRADGRVLGAIVEGTPVTEGADKPTRWLDQLWAIPIDVDAGTTGDPERLGPVDGSGKPVSVCGPQDGGWVVDGRWPGSSVSLEMGSASERGYTSTVLARYRITPTAVCIEKLAMSGYSSPPARPTLGKVDGPFATVSLYVDRARQTLRCIGNR